MDYSKKRDFILNGNMPKVILTLAMPIMFNNLIQTLYNLADSYWVSKLGAIEFAATTFVWPVLFLIISLGFGMSVAGTALISQHIGSNQKNQANKVAGQLFSFSIVLSIIFCIFGFITTPYIIKLMGGKDNLLLYSIQYLRIMFLDIPILFVGFVFNSIRQSQGDTFTPMILNIGSVILNIILDPIFIFTFNLGVAGAAIATVLSKAIFMFYILYLLFFKKEGIHLTLDSLKFNKETLLKIVKIGLPASLGQSGAALGFIVLNSFVLSYGEYTLAAFGIGNRINSLVFMPAMGIGNALATIIGQNLGADNAPRAQEAFKTSLIISVSIMLIGGLILINFSEGVVEIFSNEPEVISQGTDYLKLIAASLSLMGIFHVLIGTFQGSGHTIYAMIISLGRLWLLRIPMILLFKNYTNWGSCGVWYAMILSNFIICCVGLVIYMQGNWQEKVIDKKILEN